MSAFSPPRPSPPARQAPEPPRFSAEYVHRMRLKHQRRRLLLWVVYGLMAAIFFLPMARSFRLPVGPLAPMADFLREWDAVMFMAFMGCVLLRIVIARCPACSTALPPFSPKVHEVALLWRRRRVKCENCGIQLQ